VIYLTEHIFTRELGADGLYNIYNPLRIDVESKVIWLPKEIETALPGKVFTFKCNATQVIISFVDELTSGEITTLTNIVTAHKDNT